MQPNHSGTLRVQYSVTGIPGPTTVIGLSGPRCLDAERHWAIVDAVNEQEHDSWAATRVVDAQEESVEGWFEASKRTHSQFHDDFETPRHSLLNHSAGSKLFTETRECYAVTSATIRASLDERRIAMAMHRPTRTNSSRRDSGHPLNGIPAEAIPELNERFSDEVSGLATVLPPDDGKLYHGVFASRSDDEPSSGGTCEAEWYAEEYPSRYLANARPTVPEDQRGLAWYLFGNNWVDESCRRFPTESCRWIWDLPKDGSHVVPYVYLFTKSTRRRFEPDPRYHLLNIIDGKFDEEFRSWARGVREFGHPLMVAWGAECNGYWHSWNGMYNGIDKLRGGQEGNFEGPARFVDAYRHIINNSTVTKMPV